MVFSALSIKKVSVAALALAFVSGCNPSEIEVEAHSTYNFADALAKSFVTSWAAFEAPANALRNDPRYAFQKFEWSFSTGPTYHSNSLDHANVEYAHAAGLTGDGQLVAVIDAGFMRSHDEFVGKTLLGPGGTGSSKADTDHGTAVASVIGGSAENGSMIGVAPGAKLHLETFASYTGMTNATNDAASLGAIVQNNSWGFPYNVSQASYNTALGGTQAQAYVKSLKNFAKNGVIVFAGSNDYYSNNAELMAALPILEPELEGSWIAAINVVPTFSGDSLINASRISGACNEAAAWCMAADGTVNAASSTSNSSYSTEYTGTSFAAPQISGAIALLAEAFPDLTAQELRARLLASANNGFYDHTGYVEFAPGVSHGFDDEFGHGFLDLKAALLPIGGAYVPTRRGATPLEGPLVVSSGMVGDALTTRLANHDIVIIDGLGGGFSTPADALVAGGAFDLAPEMEAAELLSAGWLGTDDGLNIASPFADYVDGQELNYEAEGNRFALLMPFEGAGTASFGLAYARDFDLSGSTLSLGISAAREGDGFVGMKSSSDLSTLQSDHAGVNLNWTVAMANDAAFSLSGSYGVSFPDADVPTMDLTPVSYNAVGLEYSTSANSARNDRLTLGVSLPQAVNSGSAEVMLPVSYTRGVAAYEAVDIALSPTARQVDLHLSYAVPTSKNGEFVVSATHSINDGNIEGERNTVTRFGYRISF